jgi:hypothetical protein
LPALPVDGAAKAQVAQGRLLALDCFTHCHLLMMLLLLLQGKPAASKGMDRLSGRSRVRTPDDNPMDYLPQVRRFAVEVQCVYVDS